MSYHVNGTVDDYDVEGEGTCLCTALIAYAADCRRAALSHQRSAELLLDEAAAAERAATAAEVKGDPDGD
jgi:hypothetical protein